MSPQRTIDRSAPHNLPAPLTSLIGRAREAQGIADALRATRLVTLTGPGGVGKTRLALDLAQSQRERRRDGVWIVDLAQGGEPPDVAAETARALDVRSPTASGATAALRRYLAARDVLLVLDNCEHVAGACAQLASELLGSCPGVRIMATSRESLGVTGETVWRLEPLAAGDAHRLFVERARQREPGFMPDPAADAVIAQLCERLDRLPLAIELAAARLSVMSPGEILESLDASLGELGGGGRLAPPRHRTVRAAVAWSEQLLDDDERRVFRGLAVFTGGFDVAAARALAPGLSVDMLARLVDKSLVAVLRSARGATRYRLLETVREHARELLVQAGELEDAQERHLRHFATLVGPVQEGWPSPAAQRLVDELGDDYENVRAAIEWGAGADPVAAMRLLSRARELFQMLGQADGVRLARLLLHRHAERDRDRLETQVVAGALAFHLGDAEATTPLLAEARDLAVELGEPGPEAWARMFLGLNAALAGEVEQAREQLEASRTLHRQLGIRSGEARVTSLLGLTYAIAGEVTPRARELIEEAIAINVAAGDAWGEGQCHVHLGIVVESDATDAGGPSRHYRRAVELLRPFHDGTLLPVALVGQGLAIVRRDPASALRVAAAAFAMRARIGGDFAPFYRARAERLRAAAEAAVADDAERLWREGERLDVDDATALAFGSSKRARPVAAAGVSGLSAREQEVARFVAAGLSNKQIAAQLQLSVRTVESHVRRALAATGLSNRTQLATWVRERMQ